MTEPRKDLGEFLAGASVDEAASALRPDYRALLIAVDGLPVSSSGTGGPRDSTDTHVEQLLVHAEAAAIELLAHTPVEQTPHVAAWREAYRSFGAKPQRTRNSLEALLRRAQGGLPRVNRLTDVYNAVSVAHQIPLGGEDLDAYDGPPRLVRATGAEAFDTFTNGEPVVEHPDPGEVVWVDDTGVTCRRWNWRQGRRTQLTPVTTAALFILDALAPVTDEALSAAGDDLVDHLRTLGPDINVATRLLAPDPTPAPTAAAGSPTQETPP